MNQQSYKYIMVYIWKLNQWLITVTLDTCNKQIKCPMTFMKKDGMSSLCGHGGGHI